jgi:membrane protease YdiL (CAAX protease family)
MVIAYGFSWLFWIVSWLIAQNVDAGGQLFNADFVWALFFDGESSTSVIWSSLLSLAGVWGPMIGGIIATRLDPAVSSDELWHRVRRVGVGARWYGLVLGILLVVAGPAALIVGLTTDMAPDAPGAGTVLVFLVVFFTFQMLSSGTEEIGWRGYLNEKLRHGRNFWDTGWAVGLPWAAWHIPVVVFMFLEQGMGAVQIVGSLAGFGIGIVAAAILHSWFYERTESVFLNIFIHAIFNTLPLATVLLFEGSPAAVIANLALWAVVIYLKRQHDKDAADDLAQAST